MEQKDDFTSKVHTLVNPQNGNLAFKIFSFVDNSYFDHLQRHNYFSVIWVQQGSGTLRADFSEYEFKDDTIFFFTPYQPFMLDAGKVKGISLNFHPDFFCIHKHQKDVSCNGILFNNIFDPPLLKINKTTGLTLHGLLDQMKKEMQIPELAQYELIISYLKIFLIHLTRLKIVENMQEDQNGESSKEHRLIQQLKDAIEEHFKTLHSASDYAELLNITPKALAKITKNHFNKTITDMISERIVIEAKRELYLTSKPVKEIAYELGYEDEYYFSRFFKKNADISPQMYRDTVGFAKAEL
ncbi:helix-turn-helix domain-containing protein [soil metagenome]